MTSARRTILVIRCASAFAAEGSRQGAEDLALLGTRNMLDTLCTASVCFSDVGYLAVSSATTQGPAL